MIKCQFVLKEHGKETRCNWLKSNQMLKVDRRVRTLSLVTMDNNAMEKTSNEAQKIAWSSQGRRPTPA